MATANARRLASVETVPDASSDRKLEQIAALLDSPAPITAPMLKVKIWAICEGIDISASRKAFLPLAFRAGLRERAAYNTWAREFGREPSGPVVRRVGGRDLNARWIATPEFPPVSVAEATWAGQQMALYRWYDIADLLLYIGISDDFTGRASNHYCKGSPWTAFAETATIERHPTRAVALEVGVIMRDDLVVLGPPT